jgi:hypothetical protein
VHPLKYEYALRALEKLTHRPEELIERLAREGSLLKMAYSGKIYLMRNFQEKLEECSG